MKIFTPNNLTLARLFLSAGFFWLVAECQPGQSSSLMFDLAVGLFLLAGLTDVIDGYIARKYSMETSLGRLLDPFVDKILICGAFIFFIGSNFVINGRNITNVAPWMVILIIGRELLVTSLRGQSESQGKAFPATIQGKIKMFLQSAAVIAVLISLGHFYQQRWADIVREIFIWVMVIFTLISMIGYLRKYFAKPHNS